MNHPYLDDAFEVRWSQLTAAQVGPDIERLLAESQAALDALVAIPDTARTFANTIEGLDAITDRVNRAWGKVGHLDAVQNHPELRAAHNAALPAISEFFARIPLRADLWNAVRAYAATPEAAGLDPIRRRALEETLADFRESGADLPEDAKTRLAALEQELAAETQAYGENALDSLNAFELVLDDPSRLAGLPENAREAARRSALAAGRGTETQPCWRFTLHAPALLPALRHLDDGALRRQLWEAFVAIAATGPHDNLPRVRRILALRREKAHLLGKANFADVVLERRMARQGSRALAFVEDLHARTRAAFAAENAELQAFRAEATGEPNAPLAPWDAAYWSEKLRQARFAFDPEALRPYFPMDAVLRGLFEICGTLFGLRVSERSGADRPEVWHPEVRYYDLHDSADGRHLGSFYADWHPRPSKRSGAWMGVLRTGVPRADGGREPHLGYMIGNLNPPQGTTPALLSLDEVRTVFHEFGHLLHHLLGDVPVAALNGIRVAWDFVELPSQILENWCEERVALDRFARHWQTGEPVPEALFQRMIAARNFQAGRLQMRQLAMGRMDLALHVETQRWLDEPELEAALRAFLVAYQAPSPIAVPPPLRNFGHLFSNPVGYAAGYYSYKWAEVLDADAFGRFHAEGVLNPATGRAFRDAILSRGNSEPPEALFRRFLGRDPDPGALLRRSGLA